MEDTNSLENLVRLCRDGDRDAFNRLFTLYAGRLARVAEAHLNRRLAGRESGIDVVQSVFRTFFRRSTEEALRIQDATHLWHLLVQMTVFKARARWRYHTADRRNVHAELPGDAAWLTQLSDHEPGPEEAVALLDLIEAMVQGLEPLHEQVLRLILEGETVSNIARNLGKTRQSIYRIRDLLAERLKQAGGE